MGLPPEGENKNGILPASDLWSLMDRAAFAVARLRELELARFNLTIEQASILRIIRSNERPMTIEELEDIIMRRPHSISTLVNRMTDAGLLNREKSPEARRSLFAVTRRALEVLSGAPSTSLEMAFSSLTLENKISLSFILGRLLEEARHLLGLSPLPPFLQQLKPGSDITDGREKAAPELPVSDYNLWSLLERSRFAIARLRELELARFGLTLEQASILHIFKNRRHPMTIGELEDITMRQPHSISTLVNRMVSAGLLNKERSPDSKKFQVTATREAQDLFNGVTFASLQLTLSSLEARDQQHLDEILDRLLKKARHLLGVSYLPPFLQYLNQEGIAVMKK